MFDELLFDEVHSRVQKAGQPPGTAVYTGEDVIEGSQLTVISYDTDHFQQVTGTTLGACLTQLTLSEMTWVHIDGLQNTVVVSEIADHYQLHPLTLEDILNVTQRPKVEEFDHYIFTTLRLLYWNDTNHEFTTEQLSLAIGKNFILSFQERKSDLLLTIRERLRAGAAQRLRQQGCDYLAYRILDNVVDAYFLVLENVGDQIQDLEELIITTPTQQNVQLLYQLKRHMLMIRKTIWPMREAISHLLQLEEPLISAFTRVYLRDVYDHIVQAMDTIEIFRDLLASILDIYLSSLSMRMNQVMKVLTIIATIFIPITFITSVYGMNFKYMPELNWRWGYPLVWLAILLTVAIMLYYFRRNRWL